MQDYVCRQDLTKLNRVPLKGQGRLFVLWPNNVNTDKKDRRSPTIIELVTIFFASIKDRPIKSAVFDFKFSINTVKDLRKKISYSFVSSEVSFNCFT